MNDGCIADESDGRKQRPFKGKIINSRTMNQY